MINTPHAGNVLSIVAEGADSAAASDRHRPHVARGWWNSLLGKITTIFLIGAIFAYGLGALVGWQMFTSVTQERWREQARMNTQIASATLRNIYTYVAVDANFTGQVKRIVTDRPVGDDASVLYTGFNPVDVLALIVAQAKKEAWIFRYDAATGAFERIATTIFDATDQPVLLPADTPLFSIEGV
ncbi:MAG: hypothetical protein MO852_08365 [Candidatus Devosia euplotis]|nr:hypothetical protein [Candidatus Devosia euplotis]